MVRQAMVRPSDRRASWRIIAYIYSQFYKCWSFFYEHCFFYIPLSVLLSVQEKRGVINTAGNPLLLNCLETLQRAQKGAFNQYISM